MFYEVELCVGLILFLLPGAIAGALVGWSRRQLGSGMLHGTFSGLCGGLLAALLYGVYTTFLPRHPGYDEWLGPHEVVEDPLAPYGLMVAVVVFSLGFAILNVRRRVKHL